VVALLFDELRRDEVLPRFRDAALHAPDLIVYEVANACLKKMRAAPRDRTKLLEAFSYFEALSIATRAVDIQQAIALAEQMKLSVYDASYLWLAITLDAELITLDEKLAKADTALRG
jgi:predicted nucleic acid-binding protein